MIEEMKLKDLLDIIKLINENNIVKKNGIEKNSTKEDGRYVIVRSCSAGVFAGEIHAKKGKEVVLHNARRLWKWAGAASLSQLAMEGVKDPDNCMFPCEVDRIEILEAIEILNCTEEARKSIASVDIWEI